MRCSECGRENRAGIRFCEECGTRLEQVCPSCRTIVPLDRRFCGNCGWALTPASPPPTSSLAPQAYTPKHLAEKILTSRSAIEGERKHVTVLFADLRGSLEMVSSRDPEDARKLLDPILDRMMQAVHRYEGTVNQVLGDGIMALFGAPLAHEDHAVRACHAALEMQGGARELADQLRSTLGAEIKIRVGLNSGEVVVRSIGSDLRMDYTAVGLTTHLASRMEQMARPGTTLLTSVTARLAGSFVQVRSLGVQDVKGLTVPIEVYELVGGGPLRTRLQATRARALTRFVGRALELGELQRAAERAEGGRGQVVAVVGEPGVGKSRLVAEFVHEHLPATWLTLETGTVAYGGAATYHPAEDLLRSYFRIEKDDPGQIRAKVTEAVTALDSELEPIVNPLVALLGVPVEDPTWEKLDPSQQRLHTLEAVARLLAQHCRSQSLCLLFEDLHWIDAETQALLDRLIDSLPRMRMLLIVTYRPEYQHRWSNRSYYAQLPIDPLPRAMAQEFLDELLGTSTDLSPVKTLLFERTEGNPFFLEECVSDLAEKGVLLGERGAYRLAKSQTHVDVPATVQTVLAARIDRLQPDEKRLLQSAAVIGHHVPLVLLGAVSELGPDELARCLGRLQAGEFLYELSFFPAREFMFKNALTLDVAYGCMLGERRRAMDILIVEAIERPFPDGTRDYAERLAHHAFRGQLWDKAVRYAREAGEKASARSAHRAAMEHFEQALTALKHLPDSRATAEQAIDLRLDLRHALMPLGEYRRTVDYMREAEDLAQALDDRRRLGLISSHLANYLHLTGTLDRAIEHGHRALDIAASLQDRPLEVVATAYLAMTYQTVGDYRRAVDLARRNLGTLKGPLAGERLGMTSLPSVYSSTCMAWALAELGEFGEGLHVAAQGLAIAEAADHPYSVIYGCQSLGTVHLKKGDLEAAVPPLERAFMLCEEAEIPVLGSIVAVPLALAYGLSGRNTAALQVLDKAGTQAARIGDPIGHWVRTGALAEVHLLGGRAQEALPLAMRYLEQRRKLKAAGYLAWALRLLGEIHSAGAPALGSEAETYYREAQRLALERGMRPLIAHCRLGMGKLYARAGQTDRAAAELHHALDLFAEMDMVFWMHHAEDALARTEVERG